MKTLFYITINHDMVFKENINQIPKLNQKRLGRTRKLFLHKNIRGHGFLRKQIQPRKK